MYRKILIMVSATLLMVVNSGCQTAGKEVVHYDKKSDNVIVYSAKDSRSIMPKATSSEAIRDAVQQLRAKLKKNPKDRKTMEALARLDVAVGDYGEAEVLARKLLDMNFANRQAKIVLAQINYMQGRYFISRAILERLNSNPKKTESEVLNLLAMLALKEKKTPEALRLVQEAVKRNPDDIAARMNLGIFYLRFQLVESAQTQFEEILKKMPENLDASLHLAITYAVQGKYKAAEKLYAKLEGKKKKNPLVEFNWAVLKKRSKNYKGAIKDLQKYVKDYADKYTNVLAAQNLIDDIKMNQAASGTLSEDDIDDLTKSLKKGGAVTMDQDNDSGFTGNPITNQGH